LPELPEVETVARLIAPDLLGRRVEGFEIPWARTVGERSPAQFARLLEGRRCVVVDRRAKYLLLGFAAGRESESSAWLVVHLRMTGRLVVEPRSGAASPHRRFSLLLSAGPRRPLAMPAPGPWRGVAAKRAPVASQPASAKVRLDFIDPRKFGRCLATEDPTEVLPALGPEPLGEDFKAESFFAALRARSRQLKPLLLDQSFVAGLGNIYVDESLYRARLHPEMPSDRVSRPKAFALFGAIRTVLTEAIEREGSSFDSFYRTPTGQPGSYQHQFQVYGRQDQPCRACGTTIRRTVVGQRGTHFCPRCQKPARG